MPIPAPNPAARSSLLGALLALAVSGCAEHVARSALFEQIERGSAPTIVDVRSRGEFEAAHVPGALHVPFYAIVGGLEELPPAEGGEPLVLYCEHGPRAGIARAALWSATDRPVRFLEGHMSAWKRDGLPVEVVSESSPAGGAE